MVAMLIAYDSAGNIVGTLDHLVVYDDQGQALGLVDFEAHEKSGGSMTDFWNAQGAAGSKVWPEWLGGQAHDFRAELSGPPGRKRISALIHKTSGYRRERAAIEAAIAGRIAEANGLPADIRDLVGGPGRPLRLDSQGRTIGRQAVEGTPRHLPLVQVQGPPRSN